MRLLRRILVAVAVALLLQRALPVAAAAAPADIVGTFAIASWPQCTWWALRERPDLASVISGDAWDWGREARLAGYVVTTTPIPGSIAVFQPFVQWAGPIGHLGYVVAVGSGGWFQISELNFWPWVSVVHLRWAHVGPGVRFIRWRR